MVLLQKVGPIMTKQVDRYYSYEMGIFWFLKTTS